MEHKYIRHSTAGFIVWPVASGQVWHKHIKIILDKVCESGEILSAGMCEIGCGMVRCYGMSESTGIKSRPDDSKMLASQLGMDYRE